MQTKSMALAEVAFRNYLSGAPVLGPATQREADVERLLRTAWRLMTPAQRAELAGSSEFGLAMRHEMAEPSARVSAAERGRVEARRRRA
jgi:hypothetical protein